MHFSYRPVARRSPHHLASFPAAKTHHLPGTNSYSTSSRDG